MWSEGVWSVEWRVCRVRCVECVVRVWSVRVCRVRESGVWSVRVVE